MATKKVWLDLQQDAVVEWNTLPCPILHQQRPHHTMPTAYSYLRFSDAQQTSGNSIQRQIEQRNKWLEQNRDYTLDTTISLKDLGVSAFRGKNLNPEYGDLGKFIELCERKDSPIEPDSVLLLEKLDRFSRNETVLAISALTRLIYSPARITIVATEDGLHINKKNINKPDVILSTVLKLCIAHDQSAEKSFRIGELWSNRRKNVRENNQILTKRIPAWLYYDEKTKTIKANKKKEEAIKYLFKRTVDGIGQTQLVRELNEKYEPITAPSARNPVPLWNTSYISKILNDRSVLGELQPKTTGTDGKRRNAGTPIKNYYPAIIDEETYYEATGEKEKRKKEKSESTTDFINIFSGLIINADDMSSMHIQTSRTKRKSGDIYIQRRLWSYSKRRGTSNSAQHGIDYYQLEHLLISALTELNPNDFSKDYSLDVERRKLQTNLDGATTRKNILQDQLTEIEDKSQVHAILTAIKEIENQINKVKSRLSAISSTSSPNKSGERFELKTLRQYCADRNDNGNKNIRSKIRAFLPSIVENITIKILKLPNNRTIAKGYINLTIGQQREYFLWNNAHLENASEITFYGKKSKPGIKLTKNGAIIFAGWHGSGLTFQDAIDSSTGKPRPEVLEDANWTTSEDFIGNPIFIDDEQHTCEMSDIIALKQILHHKKKIFDSALR